VLGNLLDRLQVIYTKTQPDRFARRTLSRADNLDPLLYLLQPIHTGGHHKYESEEINTILNRTLISEATHKLIRDRWPSEYIPKIVPSARKTEIMASHFIDEDALAALESDKYDAFRKRREQCILTTLRKYLQP